MRISTNLFHSQGLNSIQNHQQNVLDAQLQLSTGKKINAPSDDPVGLSQVHALNRTMNTIDQYAENGAYAKSQLAQEETAITDSIESLQRVRELSIQMLNGTYSAENRQQTAEEIDQIIKQQLSMMNYRNSDGELLFAGNSVNQQAAFIEDPNNPGYYAYIGSPQGVAAAATPEQAAEYNLANYGARFVQIGFDDDNRLGADDQGDASRVRITDNGGKVFQVDGNSTPAGVDANILNSLIVLRDSLLAGDPPPEAVVNDIDSSLDQLNTVRAEIGGRQNRIETQYNAGESFKLSLEERRMELEETDVVQGITDLTKSQNALQMAQQVFTKVNGMSLFDYLR
ncbi:flagellar hook-associated protein FlgL [Thiomicrorhabdus sp. 6S3-12]|uniref:flagellar hook-associated protein FlgL n=1 Tax=Thiomicrorhabdus sp. 6S3-12 TaxID=2819681 RepID=UPI001AAD5E6C|nr:flagellar hook-associated protein FlgL [Thiomicrorhabdus sp. 6S3-12]MBO1924505.1 flagellar hook-associated protein FlgL [Thiomicrorhabdus sp. 6S3-12]